MNKYVAFLRGINVGGHHKVPMVELKSTMHKMGFNNIVTLLNSGNIIFDASDDEIKTLESSLSSQLEKTFGFSIPTIIRSAQSIERLIIKDPFKDIVITKDMRLYVSLLKTKKNVNIKLPWVNEDNSFIILEVTENCVISTLDMGTAKTPKAMGVLEKIYGKDITTRNWKTMHRIYKKL